MTYHFKTITIFENPLQSIKILHTQHTLCLFAAGFIINAISNLVALSLMRVLKPIVCVHRCDHRGAQHHVNAEQGVSFSLPILLRRSIV